MATDIHNLLVSKNYYFWVRHDCLRGNVDSFRGNADCLRGNVTCCSGLRFTATVQLLTLSVMRRRALNLRTREHLVELRCVGGRPRLRRAQDREADVPARGQAGCEAVHTAEDLHHRDDSVGSSGRRSGTSSGAPTTRGCSSARRSGQSRPDLQSPPGSSGEEGVAKRYVARLR